MRCQACGAESGPYPLCRDCYYRQKRGELIHCAACGRWHTPGACPPDPAAAPEQTSPAPFSDPQPFRYGAKASLLTRTERAFLPAVEAALPEGFRVLPQANLAAFVQRLDGARYQNELFRNVDFLIVDGGLKPCAAIEINDRSHSEGRRRARDARVRAILEEAGIPLITLWTDYGVNRDYIAHRVHDALNAPPDRIHHFLDPEEDLPEEETAVPVPESAPPSGSSSGKRGCYIATCVYGSYDCPPVWTLRRFRDQVLRHFGPGRAFIRCYYAVSPRLVRRFGRCGWFHRGCRFLLDPLVALLHRILPDSPYRDPE